MSGRFFNLLLPWMLIIVGFAVMSDISKADSPMIFTKADNGKAVTIHTNDVIRIELEAMGAAGYAWHIASLDQEYWEIISKDAIRDSKTEPLVGFPVTHMWQFRGIKAGETEIVMPYYRVWEGKDTAIDEFRLKVKILSQ